MGNWKVCLDLWLHYSNSWTKIKNVQIFSPAPKRLPKLGRAGEGFCITEADGEKIINNGWQLNTRIN